MARLFTAPNSAYELLHRRSNDVNERACIRYREHTVVLCYLLIFRYDVTRVFVKATARKNFLIPSLRRMYSRQITEIRHDRACLVHANRGGQKPVFIFNADLMSNG